MKKNMPSKMIYPFTGQHVIGDLYEVNQKFLDNNSFIAASMARAILYSNATLIKTYIHTFQPLGATIVTILAESHMAVHTYPESRNLFVDIFTCGNCKPDEIFYSFIKEVDPTEYHMQKIKRGNGSKIDR